MWIRSQDKKTLMDANLLFVNKNYGGKLKGVLLGKTSSSAEERILGFYETEDKALDELDRIIAAMKADKDEVIQIY